MDLRIAADGFVPVYRFGLTIDRDKPLDLGTVTLTPGASVSGFVAVEGGRLLPECKVKLRPMLSPGSASAEAERLRAVVDEVAVRSDGFFQVSGVRPGVHVLEATQPGGASATVAPVEVWAGREFALPVPVLLRHPVDLEVQVEPDRDSWGGVWQVLIHRASEDLSDDKHGPVADAKTDASGTLIVPRVAPGRFVLSVRDSRGSAVFTEIGWEVLQAADAKFHVNVELVSVSGQVFLGSEPLPRATLWFGGRRGSRAAELNADEDGRFEGAISWRSGRWHIHVVAQEPQIETAVILDLPKPRDGVAEVVINLPDTRVFGMVVDETDHPLLGAEVRWQTDRLAGPLVRVDDQGRFNLRALPPGEVVLLAERMSAAGGSTSEPVFLNALSGEAIGPLKLRIEPTRNVRGRVTGRFGPVPGAVVELRPLEPRLAGGETVSTDLEGRFSARMPGQTQVLGVVVAAPGHGVRAFRAPTDGISLDLVVPGETGTVAIELPATTEGLLTSPSEERWSLRQGGIELSRSLLLRTAAALGGNASLEAFRTARQFEFPGLAPGAYELCLGPIRIDIAAQRAAERCVAGQLSAGGRLELTLPPLP